VCKKSNQSKYLSYLQSKMREPNRLEFVASAVSIKFDKSFGKTAFKGLLHRCRGHFSCPLSHEKEGKNR
jgi:hypothetical protein